MSDYNLTGRPLVEIHAPRKSADGRWFGGLGINVAGEQLQVVMSASEPLLKQAYAHVMEQLYVRALGKRPNISGEESGRLDQKAYALIMSAQAGNPEAVDRVLTVIALNRAGHSGAQKAYMALQRVKDSGVISGCSGCGATISGDPFFDKLWQTWTATGGYDFGKLLSAILLKLHPTGQSRASNAPPVTVRAVPRR